VELDMTYSQQPGGGWSDPSWPAAEQPYSGQPYSGQPYSDPGYAAGGGYAYPGQPSAPAYGYGYTPQGPMPMPMSRGTNGLAIASLVVSLCGLLLLGGLPGIVGAIMGHFSRRQIRERGEEGDGLALAGMIVGYIGFGIGLLIWGFIVLVFVLAIGAANNAPSTSGY
jgi:hypothetical protein